MSKRFLRTLLVLALGVIFTSALFAACPIPIISYDGGSSVNARCPMTRYRYERSVYLITPAECAAAGLINGESITGIGWNYYTAPGLAGSAPLIVYLQNTSDTLNVKSTTWATAISGMIMVHNAATTLPNVTGTFDITLSNGSPFTYSGGGIYVAFDWGQYAGTLSTTAVAACNYYGLTSGLLGAQSNASAPTTLAASSYRPATRLAAGFNNDAGVDVLYSMGVLPLGVVSNNVFQARVTNYGTSTLTNLVVTLNITGADSFTDQQVIASLAPCASSIVSFTGFTPTANGACTVTASVPSGDDNPSNDSKSRPLTISANSYSYKYPGTTAGGGVGAGGSTIEMLAKFRSNAASQVDSVILEFPATGTGTYRISVRGDNGSGAPGTQLYLDSADRTIAAAGSVTIALPAPVLVGPGNFFVGIQQTNTTNIGLSYDAESPIRSGSFYLAIPIGSAFGDFSPGNDFKLNIGCIVGSCLVPVTVDVTPNGTTHVCPGTNITFTATALGGTGTLSYQWTENGADILGANGTTYTANKTTAGTFTYNCKVSDQYGGCINVTDPASSTGSWQPITVAPAPPLAAGLVGTPYGPVTFTAAGGSTSYTYAVTAGALPTNLSLSPAGVLSGTPTASGLFNFTVTATDTNTCTGSQDYSIRICPVITLAPSTLPGGNVGVPYNQAITASNGTGPYGYAVTAGALPAGLTLSAGGILSGTPTAGGGFSFTVTATDANGCTGSSAYSLTILAFGLSFFDDMKVHQVCFNPATGAFQWSVLTGAHAGETYSGTAVVTSLPGQMRATTSPTAPVRFSLYYFINTHIGVAQLFVTTPMRSFAFVDSNTTNDPPCS